MSIIDRIKKEAQKQNITISALAEKAGLSQGSINKWDSSIPSAEKLFAVSQILNCSMEYLLTGNNFHPDLSFEENEWMTLLHEINSLDPITKRTECLGFIKGYAQAYLDSSLKK